MSIKDLHHGFEYSQRERNYALHLAKNQKADKQVIEIASYLHDIGRGHEKEEYHTQTSVKLAKTFLTNQNLAKDQSFLLTHGKITLYPKKKELSG